MVELNIKILASHVQCTTIYSCALQQKVKKRKEKKEYFIKPTIKIMFLSLFIYLFIFLFWVTHFLLTKYQACVILPLHVIGFYLQLYLFVCLFVFFFFFPCFFALFFCSLLVFYGYWLQWWGCGCVGGFHGCDGGCGCVLAVE